MSKKKSIIIIGGGAAGFFAAINAKKNNSDACVIIIEKNAALLSKVLVSGGGRCNVTHACFDPTLLSKNYPRGGKELIGPFNKFQPKDTVKWFETRGVPLKKEDDGRMFPVTDNSQSIIDCLLNECHKLKVEILTTKKVESIQKETSGFSIQMKDQNTFFADRLILATGSGSMGHKWAKELGHIIQAPVPSLFTFNIPNFHLKELSGISFKDVFVQIKGTKLTQRGPLLITHFGLSGPSILKLSAWGARALFDKKYDFEVQVNWIPDYSLNEVIEKLQSLKKEFPSKTLSGNNIFKLPKKFWKLLLDKIDTKRLNDLSSKEVNLLAQKLCVSVFHIKGKTTHKEEFVTCGGVSLKEINFQKMESKICPNLFFAGEILDIDGITGGFNFQNAWTTGLIAGSSLF